MSEESNLEAISKFITGTGVAAGGTLFTLTGFVATRGYLTALGVPEHASISVTEYLQYGGRIFFVLVAQLAPIIALALLAAIPILRHRRMASGITGYGRTLIVAVVVVAAICIYLELAALSPEPIFSAGRARAVLPSLKLRLLVVEVLTSLLLIALALWGKAVWRDFRTTPARSAAVLAAFLAAGVQLLLLPLCFGQVFMIPRSFDLVEVLREKDQPALQGALVFSDSTAHFVFIAEKKLVEVPRSSVKEIRYVGRMPIEQIAN